MARILFSCVGAIGHFHPMVAVAGEAQRQGHQVLFVTAAALAARVGTAGFDFAPAGLSDRERRQGLRPFEAELSQLPPDHYRQFIFPKVFAEIEGPARLPDLRQAAEDWQPDIMVHDPADFAAPLVAATLGVQSIQHSWGPAIPLEITRRAAAAMAPAWRAAGLQSDIYGGMYRGLYLDICPPSLQTRDWDSRGAAVAPMRPVPGDTSSGQSVPEWIRDARPPLLYATLGTYFNEPGRLALLVAGLRDFAGSVLLTIGENQACEALPEQPAHIYIANYVPQSKVMPLVAGVVCHGGANSILTALTYGVPVVCVPQGADQFDNARRCTEEGVGIQVPAAHDAPELIAQAAREILTNHRYRDNARRISQEIEALPSPTDVAQQVFRLDG